MGWYLSLIASLAALTTVLAIQAEACGVVAGFSWIPWGAIPPMLAIEATPILQLAIVPNAYIFLNSFLNCMLSVPPTSTSSSSSPLVAGVFATISVVLIVIAFVYVGKNIRRRGEMDTVSDAAKSLRLSPSKLTFEQKHN